MSPGSSTDSYPAFAHIGLRENPGKHLNQVTCPDRESNPGFASRRANRYSTVNITVSEWTSYIHSLYSYHNVLSRKLGQNGIGQRKINFPLSFPFPVYCEPALTFHQHFPSPPHFINILLAFSPEIRVFKPAEIDKISCIISSGRKLKLRDLLQVHGTYA
ncbi:hypothetical protein ANN_11356 [Periplaneta americana]|uniref:Uncharacterized protein n=1 Tax=Periplaneta americana TaxID=6978 RepID=A0ABQ8T6I7_PERAM|nr:hypothetical protein ANN_11356 [Periplaneta americana]